jgi:starch phosphorylase
MAEDTAPSRLSYSLHAPEVEGFDAIAELALDLRWSWDHSTDHVWSRLDPELWDLTHNPWGVLQTASREDIAGVLADPAFRQRVDELVQRRRDFVEAPAWFQRAHPNAPLTSAAYFSMEYMLSEALPIYSGGLGNVAGDQLKAASDLGVPVVAVGLLYSQGYFRQVIDQHGTQQALYPYNDPGQLPITPLRTPDGEWLRLKVELPGYAQRLRAWQVQVGRVKLLLLDSNDAANPATRRGVTSELYGGGPELRLQQEIVLGIGGWRLLTALGIEPEVCHLNEGHAALAVLERARTFMRATGQSFHAALAATRAGNLFTTHTAVAAGFDRFPPALIEQYLGRYATEELGISLEELLALGRRNAGNDGEDFNMAYLAIRGSGAVNAVSRLHGEVSRQLFQPLFPRWPTPEVPVGHVTNGVHMPTWDSAAADELWTRACGKGRWVGTFETIDRDIRSVSEADLWQLRLQGTRALIAYTRERLARQLTAAGAPSAEIEAAAHLFDPNTLTLGFARRFATYKRPNLLLRDPDRLLRILTNPQRPVQLIVAGKAHPADAAGQALIREWVEFMRGRPEARAHAVFLSDYDMLLTEHLVQGVDVWINTPRRPWEACGTSGMKVLVNGGLNLSVLDGWWAEAYIDEVGWALGDGKEHGDDARWDAADAEALYDLLETQIVPEFYSRDEHGIPLGWVTRMRESMARLTSEFSTNRTVREYTEKHYLPAAAAYRRRAADRGAAGARLFEWQQQLERKWSAVRFGEVKVETANGRHEFVVQAYLDDIDTEAVCVELYADGADGAASFRLEMVRARELVGSTGGFVYEASVPDVRPAADYTPRIVPRHEGATVPLEAPQILWSR